MHNVNNPSIEHHVYEELPACLTLKNHLPVEDNDVKNRRTRLQRKWSNRLPLHATALV
jgi:hypothetical protein